MAKIRAERAFEALTAAVCLNPPVASEIYLELSVRS